MSRHRSIAAALFAVVTTLAAACTHDGGTGPSPASDPTPVKIAFLHDMSVPGSAQVVAPALLGLQLAMSQAVDRGDLHVVPEVVGFDVDGDDVRANDLVQQVVDDPTYVAAVIAPFWSEPVAVGQRLDAAGVATLSLSELDPTLGSQGWSSWRRVVAGVERESAALAAATRASPRAAGGICLVGDGTSGSDVIGTALTTDLGAGRVALSASIPDEDALAGVVDRIDRSGCGAVAWTGFGPGAILLRTGMTEAGMAPLPVMGTSAMKTESYLSTTAGAGDGTITTCACVDLSASTRPEARRFIHDFQSRYGSPPGVFGAEGWDVGGMLLAAFRAGAADRPAVADTVAGMESYDGLANTYRFDERGELAPDGGGVHVFRAAGVRWVPLGEDGDDDRDPLPVGIPGYLSVASCRTGQPYAYRQGGRSVGFDVELAAAIARRLGLMLSWHDLPCRTAIEAAANGSLDAILVPAMDVPQGTPTSGIALSIHGALVTTKRAAREHGGEALSARLGPDDTVAVVRSPETVAWMAGALRATGADLVVTRDRRSAYRALVDGSVTAVADREPDAWAAIERRPSLRVALTPDIGAHDVFAAAGPDADLVSAIDGSLARLIRTGRYAFLFAKYFPGADLPPETGT